MTYKEYVIEVFKDHNDSLGLSEEEIQDTIEECTFQQIEQWLMNHGYNLEEMYNS